MTSQAAATAVSGWSRTPGSVRVPMVDLKANHLPVRTEIDEAIRRVIDRADFILGEEVIRFESEFAAFCSVDHAVGVASGSAALLLALAACGVGPGDEVITTPFNFPAAVEAIIHRGATPVFVDVLPDDLTIDPAKVALAVSPRTRAIVPLHLYGIPAPMEPLLAIARANKLRVIEDAAQAHGSSYNGRKVGGWGDAGCFSFNPGKNLGALGDAGAVVTNDPQIAAHIRQLRDHGRATKYEHEIVGFGERLDSLQAAVLRVKLRYLDQWNRKRGEIAAAYDRLLGSVQGIATRRLHDRAGTALHLYVVEVEDNLRILESLKSAGIQAGVHYNIPLHLQPAYAHLSEGEGSFPWAEQAARRVLSLPFYPEITEAQMLLVVDALHAAL